VCEFHRVARELGVPGPVTLQNSYSLVSRNVDSDLAEVLFRNRMSLLAYSPLAGGMLTGKYADGARPAQSRYALFDTLGARFRKPVVEEVAAAYAALARERGLTPVELALGYVKSRWYLGAMIVGATSVAQLDEDIAAASTVLDAGTLAAVAQLQERFPSPAA
jgi:aryl-alcohol dehydrogenase-like predicted oxidoreductase